VIDELDGDPEGQIEQRRVAGEIGERDTVVVLRSYGSRREVAEVAGAALTIVTGVPRPERCRP
jgi:hypothetical protein